MVDAQETLARITAVSDLGPMAEAALVIEAATEQEEIKREFLKKLAVR